MKRVVDGELLLKTINNGKKNIIFGAGGNGGLLKTALGLNNVDIEMYLVNNNKKESDYYLGVKVIELSEFNYDKEKYNVIYSVCSEDQEIFYELSKKVGSNIIFTNYQTTINLMKIGYVKYFNKNNIDINDEYLLFDNIKFINPFICGEDCLDSFLFEIGDLILPNKLNDFNMIDEGPYEYKDVNVGNGDVVIDCGANIGLFSAIAASKGCSKCYAFEPVPKAMKYLKKVIDIYSDSIVCCDYALSDFVGKTSMYIGDENNLLDSSITNKSLGGDIEVNVTTIDDFVKNQNINKVDFIKADIEGAERYMLMGATETLKKYEPKLAICTYHLKDDPKVLEDIIKKANPKYVIEHKWKKLYAYVPNL